MVLKSRHGIHTWVPRRGGRAAVSGRASAGACGRCALVLQAQIAAVDGHRLVLRLPRTKH